MLSNPLVSIIIPTRNSAEYLELVLASIANQTYTHTEIIIVDNQSTDETLNIARSYTRRILRANSNLQPDQYNQAVSEASGQYIYLMEPTWILEPTIIAESILKISGDNQAIIIHTTPDNRQGLVSDIRKLEIDTYKYSLEHSVARFLPKRLYRAIGGLRSIEYGWDYDLQTRLATAGIKSIFVDAEAMDLAQPTQWRQVASLSYHLGYHLRQYLNLSPAISLTKLSPLRHTYLKYWIRFAREPALSMAFGAYLVVKYLAGSLGLTHSLLHNLTRQLFPVPILTKRRKIPISIKPIFYE